MESKNKITFIGDITCDRPLLNASRIDKGVYDFSPVFSKMKEFLKDSAYVIGNFETVCAGSKNDYQDQFMLCNTPDKLIASMQDGGIDCVTTANNHCLDQGIAGLVRTLDILDQYGIEHVGTYRNVDEQRKLFIKEFYGTKVAFLAYTYSTNESNTGIVLDSHNDFHVNLLREQNDINENAGKLKKVLFTITTAKQRRMIKRFIARKKLKAGNQFFSARKDSIQKNDLNNRYLNQLVKEIDKAKKLADLIIVCPHIGGQFNEEPGEYSKFIMDFIAGNGVDLIVGNHPHVVQKIIKKKDCFAAFSIGSFNLSISADYIVHDALPEYSIALHCYINNNKISGISFSILKIVEDKKKQITVWPCHLLFEELNYEEQIELNTDMCQIYNRVTGRNMDTLEIRSEYEMDMI